MIFIYKEKLLDYPPTWVIMRYTFPFTFQTLHYRHFCGDDKTSYYFTDRVCNREVQFDSLEEAKLFLAEIPIIIK